MRFQELACLIYLKNATDKQFFEIMEDPEGVKRMDEWTKVRLYDQMCLYTVIPSFTTLLLRNTLDL
jgi:hypothetical protein